MVDPANEPLTTADNMKVFWDQCTDCSDDGANVFASALLAPRRLLSQAPPNLSVVNILVVSHAMVCPGLISSVVIVACGADPVHDEGMAYAEALDAAGVDVQLNVYPGLSHGFIMEARLKSGGVCYDRVIDFAESVVAEQSFSTEQGQVYRRRRLMEVLESWVMGIEGEEGFTRIIIREGLYP